MIPPRTYSHSAFIYRDCLYVFGGYGSDSTDDGEAKGPRAGHRYAQLYEYSFSRSSSERGLLAASC